MTGPQHFKAADDLLGEADEQFRHGNDEIARYLVSRAQVHATLAHAAATALCQPDAAGMVAPDEFQAWHRIAGTKRPKDSEYGTGERS